MDDKIYLPPIAVLKAQAKRLRTRLAQDGDFISHSESLELIAAQYGRRDWNTLHADAGNRQSLTLQVGARLNGRYLSQPFKGEIISVQKLPGDGSRITIVFDDPVDVVSFNSFSAYRSRVTATLDSNWATPQKTSDGTPHLVIDGVH